MKNNVLKIILVFAISSLLFSSCKKYQDGPSFTLASKKSRVTGVWEFVSITFGTLDLTDEYKNFAGKDYKLTINKDGTYKQGGNINELGKWTFEDNKETLTFNPDEPQLENYSYKILRLAGKELWLQGENNSGEKSVLKYKQ